MNGNTRLRATIYYCEQRGQVVYNYVFTKRNRNIKLKYNTKK